MTCATLGQFVFACENGIFVSEMSYPTCLPLSWESMMSKWRGVRARGRDVLLAGRLAEAWDRFDHRAALARSRKGGVVRHRVAAHQVRDRCRTRA